eukprot:12468802-Heterocapsa_arctica.AAC.1
MGMQPPAANDPSKWEDRKGEHWSKERKSGLWQPVIEGASAGATGQPQDYGTQEAGGQSESGKGGGQGE